MTRIIAKLKAFPGNDIFQVAKRLKLTSLEVSQAQHEYLKQFRNERNISN